MNEMFPLAQGVPNDATRYWVPHYSDVMMRTMASQIAIALLFAQPFVQAYIKQNIKAPLHWPLWRESTGDRLIPLTMGQYNAENVSI